ncbi:MAG: hypothetical protein LBT81_03565 [Helicobacteraceae bacterium]|jgi:hypothetical protein|nr:hypothetical protein [Helicobacteraceae bacterium]
MNYHSGVAFYLPLIRRYTCNVMCEYYFSCPANICDRSNAFAKVLGTGDIKSVAAGNYVESRSEFTRIPLPKLTLSCYEGYYHNEESGERESRTTK